MATQVQLSDDEALVLFELLSSGKLAQATDKAEAHALGVVLASLETQLIVPFSSSYSEQLAAARSSLVARYGK